MNAKIAAALRTFIPQSASARQGKAVHQSKYESCSYATISESDPVQSIFASIP